MGEMLIALHEKEKIAVQKSGLFIKQIAYNTPLLMPLYDSQTNPDETIKIWGIGGLVAIVVAGFLMSRHGSKGSGKDGSGWKGSESLPLNYIPETHLQPEDGVSSTMLSSSELVSRLSTEITQVEFQLKFPHSPSEEKRLQNQLDAARRDLQNFNQGMGSFLRNEKSVIHKKG